MLFCIQPCSLQCWWWWWCTSPSPRRPVLTKWDSPREWEHSSVHRSIFLSPRALCLLAYSLCLLNSQCIKLTTILTAIRTDLSGHDVSTGLLVWSRVIWHGSAMPLQHYYYTALFFGMVYCFCSALLVLPSPLPLPPPPPTIEITLLDSFTFYVTFFSFFLVFL